MKTPSYMKRFPGLKKWLDARHLRPVDVGQHVVSWSSITEDCQDGKVYLLSYDTGSHCVQVYQHIGNSFAGDKKKCGFDKKAKSNDLGTGR
jgi:hypothetical protein